MYCLILPPIDTLPCFLTVSDVSGFIGRSWAVLFAKAGFAPCLYDIVEEQLQIAQELITQQLASMEKEGLLGGQSAGEVAKRVSFQKELNSAVKDAFYVQVL